METFPPAAHWFCPKRSDDDYTNYDDSDEDDEDASAALKKQCIAEGAQRRDCAYRFLISLGLTPEETAGTGGTVEAYFERVNALLTHCDKCVRNYHMGRKDFLKYMAE